jgi:hypothetical protein
MVPESTALSEAGPESRRYLNEAHISPPTCASDEKSCWTEMLRDRSACPGQSCASLTKRMSPDTAALLMGSVEN